ncbi:MAG: hypothetical protein ACPLKQ_07435 [Candidatus Bathyarchaeales archaeon]
MKKPLRTLILTAVSAALLFLFTATPREPFINVVSADLATESLVPRRPLLAMPSEYINYTITRVNGKLWAKVDAVFPIHKVFGAGEIFELNGVKYVVLSDELLLLYPTPPGTTNISVKNNGVELSWSNYTESYQAERHPTAIGNWPMIYCKIENAPNNFTLEIHYRHPIQVINGVYTFLYDLNISPYLSPWCNKSTAYFNIRMETNCTELNAYTVGSDRKMVPVNYTVTKDGTVEVINIKVTSEYNRPLPGDLIITFKCDQGSDLPLRHSIIIISALSASALIIGCMFLKHRKHIGRLGSMVSF